MTETRNVVRYTLHLSIERPIEADELPEDYLTSKVKCELEREVVNALRRFDGDCDCEVLTADIIAEEA